jgi:hypothetical protein
MKQYIKLFEEFTNSNIKTYAEDNKNIILNRVLEIIKKNEKIKILNNTENSKNYLYNDKLKFSIVTFQRKHPSFISVLSGVPDVEKEYNYITLELNNGNCILTIYNPNKNENIEFNNYYSEIELILIISMILDNKINFIKLYKNNLLNFIKEKDVYNKLKDETYFNSLSLVLKNNLLYFYHLNKFIFGIYKNNIDILFPDFSKINIRYFNDLIKDINNI